MSSGLHVVSALDEVRLVVAKAKEKAESMHKPGPVVRESYERGVVDGMAQGCKEILAVIDAMILQVDA